MAEYAFLGDMVSKIYMSVLVFLAGAGVWGTLKSRKDNDKLLKKSTTALFK